jgi:hypothetical protein
MARDNFLQYIAYLFARRSVSLYMIGTRNKWRENAAVCGCLASLL